jgi:nucleoside 2-deoxyribosyltransferase
LKIYVAGPLFSEAERAYIDGYVKRFREAGIDCFVPHEQAAEIKEVSADAIFDCDYAGIAPANAVVAWLDGPMVDDGTAVEIGIYYGLMQQGEPWRKGILGLITDNRLRRRKDRVENGGLNFFVAGTIGKVGKLCWSVDEVLEQLLVWKRELGE